MAPRVVEITFYPMTFPKVTAYYLLDHEELDELKLMYEGLYIENFIGEETLSRDNCDFHVYEKGNNIHLLEQFLTTFGNPCDLLSRIKALSKQDDNIEAWNTSKSKSVKNDSSEDSSEDLVASIAEILDEGVKKSKDKSKILELVKKNSKTLDDIDVQEIVKSVSSN